MRTVRKVVMYVCTLDMSVHPDAEGAKKRAQQLESRGAKKEDAPQKPKKRRGATQVERVRRAVEDGATTAREISERTGLTVSRVHALLTYLRNRGLIAGYGDDLQIPAVTKGK